MAAQMGDLPDFALQRNGAFGDAGCRHQIGRLGRQTGQGKLVHIPAGLDAAQVGGLDDGLGGQVDHKLALFFNNAMRMALGTNGHIGHGRLAVDDARPGGGEHVVLFHGAAADQRGRCGGQQSARLPL